MLHQPLASCFELVRVQLGREAIGFELIERVGEAAGAVCRHERDGTLPARAPLARAQRCALLHHHESRSVLTVVLDRLREDVESVASRGGLAGDGGGARLALLRDGTSRAGGVVVGDRSDLA